MSNIYLDMANSPTRMALKAMLEAEGHSMADNAVAADAVIAEDCAAAIAHAARGPALVLAAAAQVGDAVAAMRKGVYGYIFLPLQPGEAGLMVRRACGQPALAPPSPEPAMPLAEAEMRLILDTLRRCRNNKTRAARELGIGRNTLWRKLAAIRAMQRPGPRDGG